MLYFRKKSYPFQLIFQAKAVYTIFLTSLCFCDEFFGAHYPLRHWLPLTVRLPLTRRINLDSSKRKAEQIVLENILVVVHDVSLI